MNITSLPMDILVLIPYHLHNIEDFMNASSSCRTFRHAFSKTDPNQVLRLAAAASRIFFKPDPHFLVAATARQVSDWALQTPNNTEVLRQAFLGGVEGLLELCVERAGLTMDDIRRIQAARFSTINPAIDFVDRLAGNQWYDTPRFWDGGVSDAATLDCVPARTTFQIVIYGELFASTFRAHLEPHLSLPSFDLQCRLDFIRYCVPDWTIYLGYRGSPGIKKPEPIGPYRESNRPTPSEDPFEDQIALQHVLKCRRWCEAWDKVHGAIGYFEEDWKQHMWESVVQCQGLEGLELLRPGGIERWSERLSNMWRKIALIEKCPNTYKFGHSGQIVGADYPHLADEVSILIAAYWERH